MAGFTPTDDLRDLRLIFNAESGLTAPERSVVAVLILHRNGTTGRCDPSLARIADGAGIDRRTVTRALASLEDAGWVKRRVYRDGRTRTNYTVHPQTRGTEPLGAESPQTRGTVPHERTRERTKERTAELWDVFVAEMDGKRLTFTDTRRKKLDALHTEQLASESDPVAAFRKIMRTVKASDYHMSNRDYHMPESLFLSSERRERWAEKARTDGGNPSNNPLMMSADEVRRYGE